MTSLFPFFPFSWNQITLCRGRNQRYVQNRQIQPCHFDKYCSLTLRNNSVVLQPSTRQHIHPISADTLGEDDFQDEHLQQEPRQEGALWGGEELGVEGADHPWEEKAGHLEVRFCNQFISPLFLSTSAVEVATMAFLVMVATYAWFNGLTKSINEFADEN